MSASLGAPDQAHDVAAQVRQAQALSVAAIIRLIAGSAIVAVAGSWMAMKRIDSFILLPLLGYLGLAIAGVAGRRRPLGRKLAPVMPFLDLTVGFVLLRHGIATFAGVTAAWAVISLAVATLVVAVAGVSLRGELVILVTALAAASQWVLLRVPGVTFYSLLLATFTIVFVARATNTVPRLIAAGVRREQQAALTLDALAQVQRQNRQLEFLQREKDSLLEIIVHDMRGPVGAAMLSLEYLGLELKKMPDPRALLEASDDAITTLNSLSGLISQILDTSKLEAGRITLRLDRTEVRPILENTLREATPRAAGRSIRTDLEAPEGLFAALDLRLFPRALSVLATHLLRHTLEGGRMLLVATGDPREVRLSLHSTAPAVPAAERERIFDKFPVAEGQSRPSSSWALGLYFCRLVVSSHQGSIAVEDVDGWPTSFVIRLPSQPRPA